MRRKNWPRDIGDGIKRECEKAALLNRERIERIHSLVGNWKHVTKKKKNVLSPKKKETKKGTTASEGQSGRAVGRQMEWADNRQLAAGRHSLPAGHTGPGERCEFDSPKTVVEDRNVER